MASALPLAPAPLAENVRGLLDLAPFPAWAADVRAPGQPLVYANDRFVHQTGGGRRHEPSGPVFQLRPNERKKPPS